MSLGTPGPWTRISIYDTCHRISIILRDFFLRNVNFELNSKLDSLVVRAKGMSKYVQLYYPARGVGTYLDLHQHIEFSVLSGYVDRSSISRSHLNLFRQFFSPCQYKNAYMFHGERSASSVLFPNDECQLLDLDRLSCLFFMGLQDLLLSLWKKVSFWKKSEKYSDLRYLPGDHGIFLGCRK